MGSQKREGGLRGDRRNDRKADLTMRLFDDTPVEDFAPTLGECNLEEFPSFGMDRRDEDLRPRSYSRTIDTGDNVALESEWTVIPSSEHGPLGPTDQDVFVAVQALIGRRGGLGADGELEFSFSELGEALGWSKSGKNHRLMKDSLLRLQQTTFRTRNAFYSAESKSYVDDSFRVWDVTFSEISGGRGRRSRHRLIFGKLFLQNWLSGYLKGVDVPLYRELTGAVSRRLYRLIDAKTRSSPRWEESLVEVGRQIPLSDARTPSRVADRLRSAHEQLEEVGYLSEVRIRDGWVAYEISPAFRHRRQIQEVARDATQVVAIERLVVERVRPEVAIQLVEQHGAERCMHYADAIAYQEGVRNRPGWLVNAIKNGWSIETSGVPEPLGDSGNSASTGELFEAAAVETGVVETGILAPSSPDPDAEEVWQRVLDQVSGEINAPSLRVWFEGTVAVAVSPDILSIAAPNEVARDYIESRFKRTLEEALAHYLSPTATLEISVSSR
jgi:hypothetical protein